MSQARWQPVVLILNDRLECTCGSLAVFVNGEISKQEDDSTLMYNAGTYCQDCWQKYIEEDDSE